MTRLRGRCDRNFDTAGIKRSLVDDNDDTSDHGREIYQKNTRNAKLWIYTERIREL